MSRGDTATTGKQKKIDLNIFLTNHVFIIKNDFFFVFVFALNIINILSAIIKYFKG